MRLLLLTLPVFVLSQSCQPGAVYNAQYDRCYTFSTTSVLYSIAEQNCINLQGHLVSIQNAFENSIVNDNAKNAFININRTDFWIGANDLVTSEKWQWTDGKNFLYSNWRPGQPQIGLDCATSSIAQGKWQSIDCFSYRPYVCASPPVSVVTCPPAPTCPACPAAPTCSKCVPHCDSEWTYFINTDSCYKTFYDAKWDDAEAFCIGQGGHLTSIHSEEENTFIANLATTKLTQDKIDHLTWIGLYNFKNEWVWSDNTDTNYYNWAPKKPESPGKDRCAQIAQDKSHDGWYENWNNVQCSTMMRAFVCKKASIH